MTIRNILISTIILISFSTYAQNADLNEIIKQKIIVGKGDNSISADGIILYSQDILPSYYEKTNYQQSWSDMDNITELIEVLNDSYNEGLIPDDYHLVRINNLIEELSTSINNEKSADLDLILTDATILYAKHLIVGKVSQTSIRPGWDIPQIIVPEESQG